MGRPAMTTSQSLGDWLGDGAVAGVEAAEALARLRNVMFDRDAQPIRLGRYTELEPLGRGGMGVVYRARDEVLGRPVALKVLRVDHAIDRRRLVSEARAMAQLNDDHVVRVFDVGEHEEETFVAME
ncbi:MAG: protein kinase, partial [Myxococcota bacterium]